MPTYEYRCEACGERFERFQKMNDAPIGSCPECGGAAKRMISAGGGIIVRNGSGQGPRRETACGNAVPCCGRGEPCGGSGDCR